MGLKRIKISELTLSDNLKGLYTIGVKLINGVQTSVKVSLEHIQTAYENAVAAAKKAETAANSVNNAITQANTAATNAQQQATAAQQATEEAIDKISEMNAGLERLEELEDTLTAQARQQPTSMTLKFPPKITKGNKEVLRITASLSPAGTGNNVFFLGDDKAVSVAPDGFLTVNGIGTSRIHVIPTENTGIYQTINIEVVPLSVRLCTTSTLRLTANGAFRFN